VKFFQLDFDQLFSAGAMETPQLFVSVFLGALKK
jgi:hypothetical protein